MSEHLPIGTRVRVGDDERSATVAGVCLLRRHDEIVTLLVVELARGFYDPTNRCYVSYLVAHPDNVRVVRD